MTSRVAILHRAPDRTLDDRVLLRLTRSRVSAADSDGVAVVNGAAAGERPTVVRAESVRAPHGVHVGDELLHTRGGLFRFIPYGRIHLEVLSTNMIR